MRTARAKIEGGAYYHVMNRILERRYILKDEVAEKFRSLMRQVEAFTGVQVVTYCLMTNHVHLLLRVPQRQELTDPVILARLEKVSSPTAFAQFMDLWNRMVEQQSEAGLNELRQSVLKRMFDISFFMKELKQRFTQWYNRRAKRNGTLWQDRFKARKQGDRPQLDLRMPEEFASTRCVGGETMRTARAKIEGSAYYHVMNRILGERGQTIIRLACNGRM